MNKGCIPIDALLSVWYAYTRLQPEGWPVATASRCMGIGKSSWRGVGDRVEDRTRCSEMESG